MKTLQDLISFLDNSTGARVVCVGDVMLDRFVYGTVSRVSPEAPVPVLLQNDIRQIAGGAANVAANLAALGLQVDLFSVTGADDTRTALQNVLDASGNIKAHLLADAARPTICKTRFCTPAQHVMRLDTENTTPIAPNMAAQLLSAATEALKSAKALIISDYGKGVLTPDVLAALIAAARTQNIYVLVDPKGADYTRYKGASIITPNLSELKAATQMPVEGDDAIQKAATHLIQSAGIDAVLATRSADGMTLLRANDAPIHAPTHARHVRDVSGAGDSVLAGLCAALVGGADLPNAITLASMVAGLAVEQQGTSTVRLADLKAAYAAPTMVDDSFAPLLDWQAAKAQMQAWQDAGLKVGFTNGCFDILHQGHVRMLGACKAKCDKLVLGLNADASVRRLKGDTRPVNAACARASVISALASIDAVVMFGDDVAEGDNPLKLMQTLRPDVIFKGKDYTVDQVIGADFVTSYGGKVELIDLEDGFSTTSTIKKMSMAG